MEPHGEKICKDIAKLCKTMFDALMKQGFDCEQSLDMMVAMLGKKS